MKAFDTHVCIVSGEPLPNFLPAISGDLGRAKIVLLESPPMRDKANLLEAALQSKNRSITRYPIDDTSDLVSFRNQIQAVLARHPHAALNATGGLKTMSLIAYEVFRAANRPVFYSERDNRIIWLNPIEQPQQSLPGLLTIESYLSAFGQPVLQINREPHAGDGGTAMLTRLHTLPKAGKGDHTRIGEKFESLVFRAACKALQTLPPSGIQDIAWGVKAGGNSPDEFDVVIVRDNILYLIECKNVSHADGFNSFINKLDALRRKRGITARTALITTAHIPQNGGNAKRAAENRILLLGDNDLPLLSDKLKNWLKA